MTSILIDTNIILDVFLDRPEFVETSSQVLALAELGQIRGHLCASAVDTLDYLLRKPLGLKASRGHLRTLRRFVHIAPVDQAVIDAALALDWLDLEDAIVHECARLAGLNAIVTRDIKGYSGSVLPVLAPIELLAAWIGRDP